MMTIHVPIGGAMADERWRHDLVARRRKLGLSLEEIGGRLGLPPATMGGLEDGSLFPSGILRARWEEELDSAARGFDR